MNKTMLVAAVGISLFALTNIAGAQNAAEKERYIITVHPGNAPVAVANSHGISATHVYTHVLNGFAGEIPPGRLVALANDPRVSSISIDHQVFAFARPGGGTKPPPSSSQVVPVGVERIGAKNFAYKGSGVGVAILDTGLDFNHQDLPVSKTWYFVSPGFTYTESAQDDAGHGTHVGGIVAALDNTMDVVGVAPGATLYAVKVLDNAGSGYDSDIISGLDWVVKNGSLASPAIKVVNMSLGRGASAVSADDLGMHNAIRAVVTAGITVVVAAGNDQSAEVSQMVPAKFPEVITVASTTATKGTSNTARVSPIQADTASYFTTDGEDVTISAPGEEREDIRYPRISSVGILSTALGGGTTRMSGTSMAAPHVAGVVALLLEKARTVTPPVVLLPADVKLKIRTGDKVGTAPYDSPTTTYTFDNAREGVVYVPNALQ